MPKGYIHNNKDAGETLYQYNAHILKRNNLSAFVLCRRMNGRIYTIITDKLKIWIDAMDNVKLRHTILQAFPFWTGAALTGLAAVAYAKLFSWAESLNQKIFHYKGWVFFILSPLFFVIAQWMVFTFAPYARGSGIPQVTAAIELSNPRHSYKVSKLLSLKIIVVKICSSIIMVIGGGVIGREGPTIHIAGSIFRKINNLLPEWWPKVSKQNMVITGAASGLAAAFNTPLGGIVFAIEELTKTHISFFKTALLSGVIISGLTALSLLGPYLYLGYPVVQPLSAWIIVTVMLVSTVSGTAGSCMAKAILHIF
jgi:H+/Cl- antiporter ClcA